MTPTKVFMPEPLRAAVRERAKALDVPMGEFVRQAIAAHVERTAAANNKSQEAR